MDYFLVSNDRSITLLDCFSAIRQIYKKYNTILASRASSERLFSKGKLLFNRQPESKHYSTLRVEYGRNGSARAA